MLHAGHFYILLLRRVRIATHRSYEIRKTCISVSSHQSAGNRWGKCILLARTLTNIHGREDKGNVTLILQ